MSRSSIAKPSRRSFLGTAAFGLGEIADVHAGERADAEGGGAEEAAPGWLGNGGARHKGFPVV